MRCLKIYNTNLVFHFLDLYIFMLVKTIRCHGPIFEDRKNLKIAMHLIPCSGFVIDQLQQYWIINLSLFYIVLKLWYPISLSEIASTSSTILAQFHCCSEDNKCLSNNSQCFWEKRSCTVM